MRVKFRIDPLKKSHLLCIGQPYIIPDQINKIIAFTRVDCKIKELPGEFLFTC